MNYKNILNYALALYVAIAPQESYAARGRGKSVASAITSAMYTVQKGDTLEGIARRAGVEQGEILKCNSGLKVLKYDTQVRLYDSYTVQVGDTFSAIAWKKGVTLGELVGYNPKVMDVDSIYAGQRLKVMCREERADKKVTRGVEPEEGDQRERRGGIRVRGEKVRYPSGLELAVVKDQALIGKGMYFNGASRVPLVRVRREDLFQRISKHFVVAEFIRVEEKEKHCIDARALPYVRRISGDYYFTHARIDPELVRELERVRVRYRKSLELEEGYRPPFYNRCVGGSFRHTTGGAVDIHAPAYVMVKRGKKGVRQLTPLYTIVADVFANGGKGKGPTTTHADVVRKGRWWY